MDGRQFKIWLQGLEILSPAQQCIVGNALEQKKEKPVEALIDGVEKKPACPHCKSVQVVRNGHQDGLQMFKCKSCGKRFNRLSKTPLSRLRFKAKWQTAVESIREKDSLSQMQERLGISRDTAHRWRQRLLGVLGLGGNPQLSGVVEADETFIRNSFKGQRVGLFRTARKRGGDGKQRGLPLEEYSCVWVARDRNKATAHHISMHRDESILKRFLGQLIQQGSVLCSDGRRGYAKFTRQMDGIQHVALNLSKGERVKDTVYHVQNVNNYHQRLKAWLEPFKGVSSKYLLNYLHWFRFASGLSEKLFPYNPDTFFNSRLITS
jgi:transposase-like protein